MSSSIDGSAFFPLFACNPWSKRSDDMCPSKPMNKIDFAIRAPRVSTLKFLFSSFHLESTIQRHMSLSDQQSISLSCLRSSEISILKLSFILPFLFPRVDNPLMRVLFHPTAILCSGTSAFGTSGLWVSTGGKNLEEKLSEWRNSCITR
jgi:hypothetical protein